MRSCLLAAAVVALAVTHATGSLVRQIESTLENQKHFELIDDVRDRGTLSQEGTCPDNMDIKVCIHRCNSPGGTPREGCCCLALDNVLSVGLTNSCAYKQKLVNYTDGDRLQYASGPATPKDVPRKGKKFFDVDCAFTSEGPPDQDCSCVYKWDIKWSEISSDSKLPSPTPEVPSPSPAESKATPLPPASKPPRKSREPKPPSSDSASVGATTTPGQGDPSPSESASASPPPAVSDGGTDVILNGNGQDQPLTDEAEESADGDDGVCVDETYLTTRGFHLNDMVHATSLLSPVLCPAYNGLPCGTANHKVRVNGVSLSYQQLCAREDVTCRKDVLKVNSVWSHQWQEAVHGDAHLTMYDVRYSESAQRLLHRVMRSVRM